MVRKKLSPNLSLSVVNLFNKSRMEKTGCVVVSVTSVGILLTSPESVTMFEITGGSVVDAAATRLSSVVDVCCNSCVISTDVTTWNTTYTSSVLNSFSQLIDPTNWGLQVELVNDSF